MSTEVLSVGVDATLADVVGEIRAAPGFADYRIQYLYVTDAGTLMGLVPLRELVVQPPESRVRSLMIRNPVSVAVDADLDSLEALFDEHAFLGFPVVDAAGHLLGVVQRAAVEEALAEVAQSDRRKALGVVQEELRSMPLFLRSRRRLSWALTQHRAEPDRGQRHRGLPGHPPGRDRTRRLPADDLGHERFARGTRRSPSA